MKLKIYSIFDEKAKAYAQPFYMQQDGLAMRAFGDLVNDKTSQLNKHPVDFTLWCLGEYDDNSGMFCCDKPKHICKAVDFVDVK
ncbi:MAG: nonstructural protein [Arizlama microvirus]|nr:MAG: nonstructural protein [Arizlama microvirus]